MNRFTFSAIVFVLVCLFYFRPDHSSKSDVATPTQVEKTKEVTPSETPTQTPAEKKAEAEIERKKPDIARIDWSKIFGDGKPKIPDYKGWKGSLSVNDKGQKVFHYALLPEATDEDLDYLPFGKGVEVNGNGKSVIYEGRTVIGNDHVLFRLLRNRQRYYIEGIKSKELDSVIEKYLQSSPETTTLVSYAKGSTRVEISEEMFRHIFNEFFEDVRILPSSVGLKFDYCYVNIPIPPGYLQ